MLYLFMVVHKAACQTLSKVFLKYMKNIEEVLLVLKIYSRKEFFG